MAMINPCNIALNVSNTGSECSDALKATAMIIFVPKSAKWLASDMTSFTAYIDTQIHASGATRWYPIFGIGAPVTGITEANEADVIETLEDGSQAFIRYGKYNRTFMTTGGGLCLAQGLFGLGAGNNYNFIEVDQSGQVAMMVNADGSFSGFPLNLAYGASPDLSNLKTTYKNKLVLSFDPLYYIQKGKIFASSSAESILTLRGLYDTDVFTGATASTATTLFVGVKTDCAETDLVATYGATLAQLTNFIVTNHATGAVITPSAIAIISGQIRLTGVFTSGQTFDVNLAAPSVLKGNLIEGYEGTAHASILIP